MFYFRDLDALNLILDAFDRALPYWLLRRIEKLHFNEVIIILYINFFSIKKNQYKLYGSKKNNENFFFVK